MELSKQRKLSLGVLAVALAALAADRMFLGTATPAAAQAAAGEPVTTVVATGRPEPFRGPSLASRLESIAMGEELSAAAVADVFADAPNPAGWHLTTTFGAGDRASVRIDGQTVRVGETHAGAVLVAVTTRGDQRGAIFSRDGREFFVPLAKSGAGDAR